MVKMRLIKKVKEIRPTYDKYVIDQEAKNHNKIILRLSPHHCKLNPIESAWSVVKNHVKQNTRPSKFKKKNLTKIEVRGTPEMWPNFVEDTTKEEDKIWGID